MDPERTYSASEAAIKAGVSVALVKRLAAQRSIGRKWGRYWMFTDADVAAIKAREDLRQRNTTPGPKGPRNPKKGNE